MDSAYRGAQSKTLIPFVSNGELTAVALLLVGIVLLRLNSYLLFHTTVELAGMVVALTAFSLAWNARRHIEDGFLRAAGLATGPILPIVLLHTLSYKGMGVFPEHDANLPTQFWVALRILQSGALLLATFPRVVSLPSTSIVLGSIAASAALITVIFTGWFPDCFIEGQGLTSFKIVTECAVMATFAYAAYRIWRTPMPSDPRLARIAFAILIIGALESAAFTLYVDVYGAMNMIGHMLGLVQVLLLYSAVAWVGLAAPLEALYFQEHAQKKRYQKEAGEANRDIRNFTEILTHHLQEPIRTQYIFADILSRNLKDIPNEEVQQSLNFIMDGARRQRALLRDVQGYLSATAFSAPHTPSHADEALNNALKRLAAKAKMAGLRVIREHALPVVLIDRGRLAEVFSILIDNAIEFRRSDTEPSITVSCTDLGTEVEIVLVDNGVGIAAEYREKVFNVFERLGRERNDDHTGVGLPIARKIIEQANGRIWIGDGSDVGTRVHIVLPTGEPSGPMRSANALHQSEAEAQGREQLDVARLTVPSGR